MDAVETVVKAIADRWWVLVLRGVAAILFGVLAIVMPGPSLYALVILFGVYAIADGAMELVLAAQRGRAGERWGWFVFEGLVSIGAGLVTFAWPNATAIVLVTVIGVWAILTGVAEMVAAVELRQVIANEWLLGLSGVLSIAFGVLMFVYPRSGLLAIVWMIGIYAILFGIVMIALGARVHQWAHGMERPAGGTPRFA